MPPVNSDAEMLSLCLEAFRAGVSARSALKFLKTRCDKSEFAPYEGTGQGKLQREMIRRLEYHLNLERTV